MRYPKGDSQIRRFQVRFRSDEDFKRAVQALADLGLPCTDKNAPSNPSVVSNNSNSIPVIYQSERGRRASVVSPPSSAGTISSSSTYGPSMNESRLSTVAMSPQLPTHTSTNLGSYTVPKLTTWQTSRTGSGHVSHSSPLRNTFKVPERPVSAVSERPIRPAPMIRPSSASSSSSMLASPHFSMGRTESSSASQTQVPSFYLSQLQREVCIVCYTTLLNLTNPSQSARRAPSLQTSQHFDLGGEHRNSHEGNTQQSQSQDPYRQLSASPLLPPPRSEGTPLGLGFCTEDPFSDSPSPPRTLTQIYDDMIPPRRELPFKRPLSSGAIKTTKPMLPPVRDPPKRPQSSGAIKSRTPTLAPIPEVSPVSKQTLAPRKPSANKMAAHVIPPAVTPIPPPKKRVAQRKSSAKPKATEEQSATSAPIEPAPKTNTTEAQEDASPLASKSSTSNVHEDVSPLAAKSAAIVRPASVPVGLASKAAPPAKKRAAPASRPTSAEKRKKMVDQCTQTLPIENRPTPATPKAASSVIVPELVANVLSPVSPPESYLATVDNFITKYKDRPAPLTPVRPMEVWESPGYAEMDDEQRMELVNDFLCRSLQDANFIKLCQDMEHSWRRIGFM